MKLDHLINGLKHFLKKEGNKDVVGISFNDHTITLFFRDSVYEVVPEEAHKKI